MLGWEQWRFTSLSGKRDGSKGLSLLEKRIFNHHTMGFVFGVVKMQAWSFYRRMVLSNYIEPEKKEAWIWST